MGLYIDILERGGGGVGLYVDILGEREEEG